MIGCSNLSLTHLSVTVWTVTPKRSEAVTDLYPPKVEFRKTKSPIIPFDEGDETASFVFLSVPFRPPFSKEDYRRIHTLQSAAAVYYFVLSSTKSTNAVRDSLEDDGGSGSSASRAIAEYCFALPML